MGKHFFTPEEEAYIKANYLIEPAVSISARFGLGKGIVSTISNYLQPYFKQEITVVMSTDGMAITDDDGELGFVETFINDL